LPIPDEVTIFGIVMGRVLERLQIYKWERGFFWKAGKKLEEKELRILEREFMKELKAEVKPTLDRIKAKCRHKHGGDGAVHVNQEGFLPPQKDPDYYREFVHSYTEKAGVYRVIIGKSGEVYFFDTHYKKAPLYLFDDPEFIGIL
jgi:hypothetical protein